MANTTISPNMTLPIPVVGVDPGPDWATNIDACLSIIDSHNHTAGQGVQITPAGININTNFPMNGNNLITARTVRFLSQTSTPALAADLGCLYEAGVDLYYIDGSGNNIRLTQSGAPAGATGTITGLPSGTASASYAAGTFTFQSATNTPATINVGSVVVGQQVASGKNVTIAANGSQAANYNLTLPLALPSVSSFITSDASGNLSFADFYTVSSQKFLPVFTSGTNTNFVTPTQAFVTRIGTIATVIGAVTFGASGAGNVIMRFTVPFASNFSVATDLAGNGTSFAVNPNAQLYAEPINDLVEFLFVSTGSLAYTLNYTYSYQII